jgi:dihydrofolate reductase
MAKLIYSMLTSLDGFTEDARGRVGWGAPDDEEVHSHINELGSSIGTYLYGRRMYDTMVYWESFPTSPDQPPVLRDWALQWQSAQKVVFSRTLTEPRSARTRIERQFDPATGRRLKDQSTHDISIDGPELAAQAIAAGTRFFPKGVALDLALIESRPFRNGVVVMRYTARR